MITSSEQALVRSVANTIRVPRHETADSFVLHAPLELLARAELLNFVDAPHRDRACDRIRQIGERFSASGEPVSTPRQYLPPSPAIAAEELLQALNCGDLDRVDSISTWIDSALNAQQLATLLAPRIVQSLAAAGHSPILFDLLLSTSMPNVPLLFRGPARHLAKRFDWRIEWMDSRSQSVEIPARTLFDALIATPQIGSPGSTFIYPVMHQADEAGVAKQVIEPYLSEHFDSSQVSRDIQRAAAMSMIQESLEHTPFGWTHCLTMAQSVLALADRAIEPSLACAVASTYVVGFRAAQGSVFLDPAYVPERSAHQTLVDALHCGPSAAAAFAWHAPVETRAQIVTNLATSASAHEDAHLVKYTLACIRALSIDPPLFLAAAAFLSAFWSNAPASK
jgi:hypothetical protein